MLQVCIKEPGQINGQMFIIEDCEDCDIYVCDYTAQVQIDFCKNCRIFVGPSESSVSAQEFCRSTRHQFSSHVT
jgi:hypothetical protein